MQSRRDFLKRAAMLMAGGMIAPRLLSSCANSPKYLGLQLYSLRDMIGEVGIEPTLEAVAQMGYNNLENAGYGDGKIYGMNPTDYKNRVEGLGMRVTSCHIGSGSNDFAKEQDWWKQAIAAHKEAGLKYIIVPWSNLGNEGVTLDDVKRQCEYFNQVAEMVGQAGMKFGYHNHNFEFLKRFDNVPLFDYMVQYTDADKMFFELDVYWITKGGCDAVEYMKKYADRIQVLHIKDETAIGAQNVANFEAIFNQAIASGKVKDWYVEVERYDGTPQEDVKKSADFLLNAPFVKNL